MNETYSKLDRSNVQGLILRGYTHPFSCHLLFSFINNGVEANTKIFFDSLYDKVQSAVDWGKNKPVSMLNIGITFNGIKLLSTANPAIVKPADLNSFPSSFQNGPWSGYSQQSLTDIYNPASVPSNWWNGNGDNVNANLHCIVHVYALSQQDLDELVNYVTAAASKNGLVEILPLAEKNTNGRLYQTIVDNDTAKIHFGYTDGISEPALGVSGSSGLPTQEDFSNFIIGYGNSTIVQPGPFDNTTASIFAKDGCYNAFRILYQDVATFNNFLKQQATKFADALSYLGLNESELEEWFAAKLCGRWRNGSPLMLSPDKPSNTTNTAETGEDFGYISLDNPSLPDPSIPSASRCPFSAHTRVANPRNQNLIPNTEGTNGPPRILRRGIPYGPQLKTEKDDGLDRGLIGLFLCGDFALQFEKLYGWMNYNNFSVSPFYNVIHPPQDAILGNRSLVTATNSPFPGVTSSFIIPIESTATSPRNSITIDALPQFIATRGTAYCLLPSLRSLAEIAGR